MKILKARADEFNGELRLAVLVDEIPPSDSLIFQRKEVYDKSGKLQGTMYYAETDDGYVRFYYADENSKRGYGGSTFTLNVQDNDTITQVHVVGPWSSRAGCVHELGFGPCVETIITDDPKVWERGYTYYGAHLTLEVAKKAAAMCKPPLTLVKVIKFTPPEVYYELRPIAQPEPTNYSETEEQPMRITEREVVNSDKR